MVNLEQCLWVYNNNDNHNNDNDNDNNDNDNNDNDNNGNDNDNDSNNNSNNDNNGWLILSNVCGFVIIIINVLIRIRARF